VGELWMSHCGVNMQTPLMERNYTNLGNLNLNLMPWTISYTSKIQVLNQHAIITLNDVPPNFCTKKIIQYLLNPFCWVEQGDDTAEANDTSQNYTCMVWCNDLTNIPRYLKANTIPKEVALHMQIQGADNLTVRTACMKISIDS
jgi:hypothetical protein